ncbi:MAG: enzyme repeat family protein, partial [Verrucomicrobiaceae bacterium]|nr:enzyme repeat family protein [Verrucomicrobiaceae bacterium]
MKTLFQSFALVFRLRGEIDLSAAGNDETRMTNDESMTHVPMIRWPTIAEIWFGLGHSSFIRHSSFWFRHSFCPNICFCLLASLAPAGIAAPPAITPSPPDISYQKLFGTWALDPSGFQLGFDINSSALSSKWAVVGAGSAADRGRANEGAVQVYNAATGAWMRKLLPPGAPAADQRFGDAVALSGDTLLVGADAGGVGKGAVYVYNLATGALLRTLTATGSAVGDYVGFSVAVSGNVAAVGAYGDSAQKGAVYLFNLTTGAQTAKIVAAAGVGGDVFGYSLAVEGNILAIGAPFDSGDRGAVYFHDLSTQVFIKKYQPSSSVVADHVGSTVAMHQGRVVVGTLASVGDPAKKVFITDVVVPLDQQLAPPASVGPSFGFNVAISGPLIAVGDRSNGHGRVHLYSAFDGSFIRTILPPNGDQVAQRLGVSLALTGNTLLVGASNDRTQTTNVNGQSGAA